MPGQRGLAFDDGPGLRGLDFDDEPGQRGQGQHRLGGEGIGPEQLGPPPSRSGGEIPSARSRSDQDPGSAGVALPRARTPRGVGASGGRVPASRPASSPRGGQATPGRPLRRAPVGTAGLQFQPVVWVTDLASSVAFFGLLGAEVIHGELDSRYVLMQLGTVQIGLAVDPQRFPADRSGGGDGEAPGKRRQRNWRGRIESRPPAPNPAICGVELHFLTAVALGELERRLRAQQVTIAEGVHYTDFGPQLHVRTPDGLLIRIGQLEPDRWA